MIRKVKESIGLKTFLSIMALLVFCSVIIYGLVLYFLPKNYQEELESQFTTEFKTLAETLELSYHSSNYFISISVDESEAQKHSVTDELIGGNEMSILEMKAIKYSYGKGKMVLKGIEGSLEEGKIYAILGPSGCGKTTLLSLLGGFDSPTSGQILFEGQDIEKVGLAKHRRNNVVFVFQSYNLIDYLPPQENVALTSKLPPLPILERVGLTEEESKRNVLKLSGGQQQRVAIARALASDAKMRSHCYTLQ